MFQEQIIERIKEVNAETKRVGEEIANEVNQEKQLNWFGKWSLGVSKLRERGQEVMRIQKELREQGYDVKINMQSYELSYLGWR